MVFSSYLFLFYFLPAALLVYYAVLRRAKHLMLTAASYLFYVWANPLFIVLLLASTLVDYVAGLLLSRADKQVVACAPQPPRLLQVLQLRRRTWLGLEGSGSTPRST
jgi:alginate O-acetyltransferase complex protein AlgI